MIVDFVVRELFRDVDSVQLFMSNNGHAEEAIGKLLY